MEKDLILLKSYPIQSNTFAQLKLGVHLYVDQHYINMADAHGLIKFSSRIDDLGYNQVCYYIEWLSPNI